MAADGPPLAASQALAPPGPVPRHVAIIMDGNGRWARDRGQPRVFGHRRGAEAVRRTVTAAAELGIEFLTLFAFSSENWRRPAAEVGELMGLLRLYLLKEIAELHANRVRVKVIGDRAALPTDIVTLIEGAETRTAANTGLTLSIALSYGARAELANATRQIVADVLAGRLAADAVDDQAIAARLSTAYMPDPDLIIRTSGEQRLSNFLLWQAAYTEFVFLDGHWPDFERADLERALDAFRLRDRRYGASVG